MTEHKDPIALLAADRISARELNDGWAALCTLGTVNAQGDAEQRTLVLREVESRLALFFSARAPKWQELKARPTCSVQLYLPSIQVQYRLRAGWEKIASELVQSSWTLRPDTPKKLDWLYEHQPQSSVIARAELLEQLGETQPVPGHAPAAAMGVYLNPLSIERLQLNTGVHERERWTLRAASTPDTPDTPDSRWHHEHLVP